MRNRIHTVRPLPTPPPRGETQPHADHLLMLIGEESDADEVSDFFRAMWPEVEGMEEVPPHND